ncbi:MAG: type II toxin-antitoxin system VapC family toxin [Pirellulales bacterium]
MILVDSSVWIDHFRSSNGRLVALLESEQVLMHPFVLGEVACGNLQSREEILKLMHALPSVCQAENDEVRILIERHQLHGRGVGLIDVHLLASCLIDHCTLWTNDKRLKTIAAELHIDN